MKRAIIISVTLLLAATMMAQTGTVPPPPPPQPPQTKPATPAPAPKPRVRMYRYQTVPAGGSYLGVEARDLTAERAKALRSTNGRGVEIVMVDQDSPAGKAGLQEGDVVVKFNGRAVVSEAQLYRLIRETKPGTQVALGIVRNGQPQTVQVTLADRSKIYAHTMPEIGNIETPDINVHIPPIVIPSIVISMASRTSGLTVEDLNPQLGAYFGVKDGQGVLVRSVEKGSKAEAAGLRAGDVIVRLDTERVENTRDWERLLRHHEAGTVKLGIFRDRREQTLSMVVPQSPSGESFYLPGPELDRLRMQLDRLGPQWQQEQAEIQARIAREMAAHQKEIQNAMREAQRELQRSMREMQREQRERDKAKDNNEE